MNNNNDSDLSKLQSTSMKFLLRSILAVVILTTSIALLTGCTKTQEQLVSEAIQGRWDLIASGDDVSTLQSINDDSSYITFDGQSVTLNIWDSTYKGAWVDFTEEDDEHFWYTLTFDKAKDCMACIRESNNHKYLYMWTDDDSLCMKFVKA